MEAYILHWPDKQPTQYRYGPTVIFESHRIPHTQQTPDLRYTHVTKEAINLMIMRPQITLLKKEWNVHQKKSPKILH